MDDWGEVQRAFREGGPSRRIARGLDEPQHRRSAALPGGRRRAMCEPARPFSTPSRTPSSRCSPRTRRAGDGDPRAPAPARLRGGITILKELPRGVRPPFLAARDVPAHGYGPGEIRQADWWHTGAQVPVGQGRTPPRPSAW